MHERLTKAPAEVAGLDGKGDPGPPGCCLDKGDLKTRDGCGSGRRWQSG